MTGPRTERAVRAGGPPPRRRRRLGHALAPLGLAARAGVRAGRAGAILTDVDGNEYIDYVMGQGPLILGHRPARRDRGRRRRAAASAARCSRWRTTSRAQAADAVCERMPGVDLVRFGELGDGVRPVRAALRPRLHRPRADAAVRGPLPRLVGRDPLVGAPVARDLGPARSPGGDARVDRHGARAGRQPDRRFAGTTSTASRRRSPTTASGSRRSSPSRSSETAARSCPPRATSSGCARSPPTPGRS